MNLNEKLFRKTLRYVVIIMALLIWEIAGYRLPDIFLSPFHSTLVAFYELAVSGVLIVETARTLKNFAIGVTAACLLGAIIGMTMGRYRTVQWIFEPYVNGLYSTPKVAILPLIMLWLGIDIAAKVIFIMLLAIFPMIKNTFAGVTNITPELLEPAISLKATERDLFFKVIIPSSIPFIMSGLRLSVGRGIVGAVIGEFLTSISGLGGLIVAFSGDFETAKMFAPLIILVIIGLSLTTLIKYLQEKAAPWKQTTER